MPPRTPTSPAPDAASPYKLKGGWTRLIRAARCSSAGLAAAWLGEAAFRLEVLLGLPLLVAAWTLAPDRWQALALTVPVLLVWTVELLNSALEALADAVSVDHHPLLGRAKDMGSAAVSFSLLLVPLSWAVVFWP